ncbi:hypothetical protein Y032_0069g364 [Ancylostoma ceylanicum]|uniref:PIN domain-containing protein n=3 Tax=Ancylostoma ceylanicum TaxID=53326 RepID=A0A016TY66_9BILA|nr:hypothetical protein Y032_0069g364 [Ancylostoma ceylanicum]
MNAIFVISTPNSPPGQNLRGFCLLFIFVHDIWQWQHISMRGETFYCVDEYCIDMQPVAAPDSCYTGVLSDTTGSDLQEIRELRSSKLDGKDLPQELYIYKRPLHPSEIRGCVIMDTCAVVIDPTLIELSVKNQILVMIPFPVLKELDKLHKNSKSITLKKNAQIAMQCLRKWVSNRYVFMETSSESQEKVKGFVAAPNDNDDLILKCAYRIQAALPADCPLVNKIFFVTNDYNLSLKATAHGVSNFTTQVYPRLLHASGHVEEEEPMEVDPTPEAMQPKPSSAKPSNRTGVKEKDSKLSNDIVVNKPLSGQINKRRKRKAKPKKAANTSEDQHLESKTPTKSLLNQKTGIAPNATNKGSVETGSNYAVSSAHKSASRSGSKTEVVRPQKSSSNHEDRKGDFNGYYGTSSSSYYQQSLPKGVKRAALPQDDAKQHHRVESKSNSTSDRPHHSAEVKSNSKLNHPHHYPTQSKSSSSSNRPHNYQYPSTSRSYPYPRDYPKDYRVQTYANGERRVTASYEVPDEYPAARRRHGDYRGQEAHPFLQQTRQYQGPPKPYIYYEDPNLRPRVPTKMMGRLSIVEQKGYPHVKVAESDRKIEKSHSNHERAYGSQDVRISNTSISPAEHALTKFLAIWNGLTEKLLDKIERGLSSEKVKMDIRKLYDCAVRLCEKTDLDSFKELVTMSTSLYYFFTFEPDYQNLEFASSALSSGLQLMVNRSSTPAVELVDSILRFVNDPRVVV